MTAVVHSMSPLITCWVCDALHRNHGDGAEWQCCAVAVEDVVLGKGLRAGGCGPHLHQWRGYPPRSQCGFLSESSRA